MGEAYDWDWLKGAAAAPYMSLGEYLALPEHSAGVDLFEKRARCAAAGIPSYWVVRMTRQDGPAISVERLRLTADGVYVSEAVAIRGRSTFAVDAVDPFEVTVSWDSLDRGVV